VCLRPQSYGVFPSRNCARMVPCPAGSHPALRRAVARPSPCHEPSLTPPTDVRLSLTAQLFLAQLRDPQGQVIVRQGCQVRHVTNICVTWRPRPCGVSRERSAWRSLRRPLHSRAATWTNAEAYDGLPTSALLVVACGTALDRPIPSMRTSGREVNKGRPRRSER
jgi:hypothetical protein